jgi:epsilon-lactone hydrolase
MVLEQGMISIEGRIVEKVMSLIGIRRAVSKMICNPKRNSRYEEPPKSLCKKYIVNCETISGIKCVSLRSSVAPKRHILYFHGGAYTMQANKLHWRIVENILSKTQCEITFLNYPLTPEYTCVDTMAMVIEAYTLLCKGDGQETILMGDSAGGGLALSLAQYIKTEGIRPKPAKIVLLSPWLDISMESGIPKEQEDSDLILSKEILKKVGKIYAGDHDAKSYLCSSLYGDVMGIGDIALFTGTSEILNVQARQLRDKLKSHGQKCSYHEYERMQHVWVGFPIPEAKDAMGKVISFIER